MEQKQEKIILENNFAELTPADKVVLSDLVNSEEEFDVLKQILATAPTLNEGIAPSPKLKASLMETFAAQHGGSKTMLSKAGSSISKIIILRSLAAIAAIFILFMFLFPFGNDKVEDNMTAESKTNKMEKKEKLVVKEEIIDNSKKENTAEDSSISSVQESPVQVAVNISPARTASTTPQMADLSTDASFYREATHTDRLTINDLPEQSRQVVQENPALLDVLYTAF